MSAEKSPSGRKKARRRGGACAGRRASASCTRLVRTLVGKGDFAGALKAYRLFAAGNGGSRQAGHILAAACADSGNTRAASGIYRDLIRRFPSEYPLYKDLEKLYLRSGQPGRALSLYLRIRPGNPLRRKSLKRLTGIYWRLGDLPRAISCLRREIREFGFTPRLGRELGKFYLLKRRYVSAIEQFQSALAMDKDDRETRTWLGIALMENGNFELAEYEFSELLRERPGEFQALVHMAELRIRENRLREARGILDRMDEQWPGNSRLVLCRAEIEFLEGRPDEAARLGERALEMTPFYYVWEQLRCHRILKHAYRALRETARARLHREMQKALQESRDVFGGLIRVAELKFRTGALESGKEILERILDLYPGNSRARVALAEFFLREGDSRAAVDTAEGVLRDGPRRYTMDILRAHAVLARAYARLGKRVQSAFHRRQRALARSHVRV
jgi:tetratricopeptide (TPR) repeat protein